MLRSNLARAAGTIIVFIGRIHAALYHYAVKIFQQGIEIIQIKILFAHFLFTHYVRFLFTMPINRGRLNGFQTA